MKLVLDTDVLRSGLQSRTGASRLLLSGVAQKLFVAIVTVAVVHRGFVGRHRRSGHCTWRGFKEVIVATHSNYALRVPASLMEDIRQAAHKDGVSLNGFIVQAVAEKVATLRARGGLRPLSEEDQRTSQEARAARGRADLPGDELPGDLLKTG